MISDLFGPNSSGSHRDVESKRLLISLSVTGRGALISEMGKREMAKFCQRAQDGNPAMPSKVCSPVSQKELLQKLHIMSIILMGKLQKYVFYWWQGL